MIMKGKKSKLTVTGARQLFKATANKTHRLNNMLTPMRGGFRI